MLRHPSVLVPTSLAARLLCALGLVLVSAVATASQAESKGLPITIGYQVDAEAPFFLAKQEQAFREAGLDPKFVEFISGPAQFAALANNSINIGEFGITPYVAAVANSNKFVAIMVGDDVTNSNGLVVRPGAGIKSIADLRGKRVAVVKGSSSYYGFLKALQKNHMTLSDVRYLNLTPPVIIPTYQHGEADAVWIWAPWVEKLEEMGAKLLVTNGEVGAITPSFYAANRKWLASNKKAAAIFVKVYSDEVGHIHKDRELARKPIQDVMGISGPFAMKIVDHERYSTIGQLMNPKYPLTLAELDSGTKGSGKALKEMAEFEKEHHMISVVPPLKQMFDFGPIDSARKMH